MFNDIPSPTDVLHREAAFRLKVIEDFRLLEAKLRAQESSLKELSNELARRNSYIHELHLEREKTNETFLKELAGRDSYVHELHLKREADVKDVADARLDVEHFALRLEEATDRLAKVERKLAWWEGSLAGKLVSPFVAAERSVHGVRRSTKPAFLPAEAFDYHLTPSPYRVFRESGFELEGWVALPDGRAVDGVRARIGDAVFEAEALPAGASRTDLPDDARTFRLTLEIPEGHHYLQLEARAADSTDWRSFLNAPIWRVTRP